LGRHSLTLPNLAQVKHGDLSTVTMNGNPIWPRVLLDGSQDHDGDGVADASMSCSDPIGAL
jgi:hypothetical protein